MIISSFGVIYIYIYDFVEYDIFTQYKRCRWRIDIHLERTYANEMASVLTIQPLPIREKHNGMGLIGFDMVWRYPKINNFIPALFSALYHQSESCVQSYYRR